jgi:hypothetical protein
MAECSRHLKVEFCQDFLSHDEAVTAVIRPSHSKPSMSVIGMFRHLR